MIEANRKEDFIVGEKEEGGEHRTSLLFTLSSFKKSHWLHQSDGTSS
jgi:hypothetical protein